MEAPKTISVIGSGNVATHLVKAWAAKGVSIRHIISRNKINADLLGEISCAQKTGDSLFDLDDLSDFYLIAVQDDHIEDIIDSFPFCLTGNQIVLHTSGTFNEIKLAKIAINYGCLYPLQTFSKTKEVDLKNTPFFISANENESLGRTTQLAGILSDTIIHKNHSDRQKFHVAAVFANNFTNHLFTISKDFCQKNHLEFELLWPLIEEGTKKARTKGPEYSQTGPAVRDDKKTIQNHEKLLENEPDWLSLYQIFTKLIQKRHNRP
jgi:predicted short-subunit dehydrogenase-like oxidoreductase (DUF2520 family)